MENLILTEEWDKTFPKSDKVIQRLLTNSVSRTIKPVNTNWVVVSLTLYLKTLRFL